MRCISAIVSALLVSTAIFGIYHLVVLFSNINDPSVSGAEKTTTEFPSSDIVECNENVTTDEPCFGLVMTTRNEWVAQPPHKPLDKLDLPAKWIFLTDTKTEECSKKFKCNYLVRNLQGVHMSSEDDIKYNFLVNTEGDIYEGRGWIQQSAADDLRNTSYWVAFIGNFTAIPVWAKQVEAVQRFVGIALSAGKLNASYGIQCAEDIIISPNDIGSKFDGNFIQYRNIY